MQKLISTGKLAGSLTSSLIGALLLSSNALAENIDRGKELHNENCTSCHISIVGGNGTGIYTRETRRIESHPALIKQVNRCKDSLGMSWPDDQINDVVHYLNSRFYKFEK